jgi:nitrile hydratase
VRDHHSHEEPGGTTSPYAARIRAIEALLLEKGILTEPEVQDSISYMEARSPANGAKLVARAWVDPDFKKALLSDGKTAASQLGMDPEHPAEFIVVENTPEVHNLIVCTLCSCYPRAILGRPPDWYKSFEYRSRAVKEPRAVMREFGFEPPEGVEVLVHDSTADARYMVLPMRPPARLLGGSRRPKIVSTHRLTICGWATRVQAEWCRKVRPHRRPISGHCDVVLGLALHSHTLRFSNHDSLRVTRTASPRKDFEKGGHSASACSRSLRGPVMAPGDLDTFDL